MPARKARRARVMASMSEPILVHVWRKVPRRKVCVAPQRAVQLTLPGSELPVSWNDCLDAGARRLRYVKEHEACGRTYRAITIDSGAIRDRTSRHARMRRCTHVLHE